MFSISHFFFSSSPVDILSNCWKRFRLCSENVAGHHNNRRFYFFSVNPPQWEAEVSEWWGCGWGAGGAYTSNYWKKNIHFVLASEKNTQIFLSGSNYSQYWCITTAQFFLFSWNALHSHLMLIHLRSCTHLYDHIALVLVFQWRFRLLFLVSNSACSKGAHEEFFVLVVSLNWRQ